MKINTILDAIDGSTYADMAQLYAIDLAKDLGSKINVFHVQTRDETEEEASHILKAATQLIMDSQIKDVNEILSQGDPGDVIVKTGNDLKADVIIMGNRGLNQSTTLFLGSVSNKVVLSSTGPVLIVKKSELGA